MKQGGGGRGRYGLSELSDFLLLSIPLAHAVFFFLAIDLTLAFLPPLVLPPRGMCHCSKKWRGASVRKMTRRFYKRSVLFRPLTPPPPPPAARYLLSHEIELNMFHFAGRAITSNFQ